MSVQEPKRIKITGDVELEYVEQGNAGGIPVILLHGMTDSWRSYEMILPHLPASLHVYALSLRGHGNSSRPLKGYHPNDFSKDIAVFMKNLDIRNAVLVGHSMGSTIVQHFAVNYPELTWAIVLIGPFANYDKPGIREFKKAIDQLSDPVDSLFAADFQESTIVRSVPEKMMNIFIEETRKLPAYVWQGVAAGWSTSNFLDGLSRYKKPALIVWGDKDVYTSQADQELLKATIKCTSLVIYKGTGHALHWEEPQRFAKDLAEFVGNIR